MIEEFKAAPLIYSTLFALTMALIILAGSIFFYAAQLQRANDYQYHKFLNSIKK